MDREKNNRPLTGSITRNAFLKLGLLISGAASSWGIFRFLSYEAPEESVLDFVILNAPITYPLGTMIFIREVKAWLMHNPDGFYAVSATCTHLGCSVNMGEGQFNCPCHGSQFDLSGSVLQGPASTSLPGFEVSLTEDGRIMIDRRVTVPTSQRLLV